MFDPHPKFFTQNPIDAFPFAFGFIQSIQAERERENKKKKYREKKNTQKSIPFELPY